MLRRSSAAVATSREGHHSLVRCQTAWWFATRVISLRWLRERTRHLHGQPLRTAEKQPIEGYSREFADDPQRHFLAERSTALDIVQPTAIDTKKSANFCWSPRPLKPIASRKRRARFDASLPGKLQSTTSLPTKKSGDSNLGVFNRDYELPMVSVRGPHLSVSPR